MSAVEVINYKAEFKSYYVALNTEWINTHFAIEAMDIAQLENPEENILEKGGEIFFILEHGQPVGTCALVPHGNRCYELAKMAVAPEKRGNSYGELLMQTALLWAKSKQATKVVLLSNTVLQPAIQLYKKFGFITTHLGPHPDYARCNIEMELSLKDFVSPKAEANPLVGR